MKNTPKIRFKGFTDDWEQRKLNTFSIYSSSPLTNNDIDENGKYDLYDANGIVGKTNKSPNVVNYISIIKDGAGVGRVRKLPKNTSILGTMGAIIPNDSNYDFLYVLLENTEFIKLTSGGTIPHIYFKQYSEELYYIPSLLEQQQIGTFFRRLDNLITLHQRKCDELKSFKKMMLKKMFPQEGQNVPEFRFKGFTVDWEQRKLGELADIVGGGTPSTAISKYWDGNIDWYAPAEISDQIYLDSSQRKITDQGFKNSSAKMLPVGTVLFTSRAGIGKTAILSREGCTNQGFQSIVPHKNELDSYFIFSRTDELKKYGELTGAGSTFVEVSGKQMANMVLMMPPTFFEQQKIGQYFANLDNLVTIHQRKCDKLKEFKKYMLKNMFI